MDANQIRLLRLRSQRLISPDIETTVPTAQVLREVCGIQAQDLPAAQLAIHARDEALSLAAIESARQEERSIVRTWGMRGTLHLFAVEDARWMVPFLGPIFIAADRRRFAELGWDAERSPRALRILADAIARQGELTREERVRILKTNGLPYEGQAPVHLIFRAAMEGILCEGAGRGSKPTYVSFEDWVGSPRHLPDETALAELARRYLTAYGPASPDDFTRWSGLKTGDARKAWRLLASEITSIETTRNSAYGPLWTLKTQISRLEDPITSLPVVRLLPRFDNYLLGYARRDLIIDPAYARRVNAGGGIIHPTLIADGRILGTWKTARRRASLEVNIEPFPPLPDALLPGLEREAAQIGRFLNSSAILRVTRRQQ